MTGSSPRRGRQRRHLAPFGTGRDVVSVGLESSALHDAYHTLLTMRWRAFFLLVFLGYVAANGLFALGYWALGDGIENAEPGSFRDAFFFSVQTLATIGYGKMAPRTLGANLLVALEALLGMVGLAVTTGLVFARFSRPTARVLFSKVAVVGPYEGVPSLMFRMANARSSQIVEARLKLTLIRNEITREGRPVRRLHDLALVRSEHAAFALTWTAVHPITPGSPLAGAEPEALREAMADLVVSLTGIDEGLSQSVHARHGYRSDDIRWGSRFADILTPGAERSFVDYDRFHDVEPLDAAPLAPPEPRSVRNP
ncbi:ion channel [Anaeromyxobacter diazotrophicus]|uniref:Inward rectifier potassium channel protein n=1 Tax=Anaeromyxobacter diazotrophicus TaxID=2590199 RepID=A0A7I9VM88_9BACT|nr:ion channel [Anaeromyxobacter diazotrophicus]GEJ57516.1 inward rectifier potassium channel protein [Anaeromyxobacter diazotrophicus]